MGLAQVRSPVAAGNANRRHLLAEADQPLGQAFRAYGPRMWPGVPWEAWLGFTTSANMTDNTTTGDAAQPFHEIGVGQVPAGPRTGPAPNPNPAAANNAWGALASDPGVVAVLGRPATMVPNAWKTAPQDQAAMTIANLRRDYASTASGLDARIRPTRATTPWAVAVAYTGFSMGAGGARAFFNRYADRLAAVPEERRWAALLQLLNDGIRGGTIQPGRPGVHGNPFYDAMRTWQKMESARQLAQGTHGDAGFFASGLPDEADVDAAITAGARGEHPGATTLLTAEQQTEAGRLGGLGVAGWTTIAATTAAVLNRGKILEWARTLLRAGR